MMNGDKNKYYRLLVGPNVGKVVLVDAKEDYEHFEYSFGKEKWEETNIFVDFLWPYDEKFEKYQELNEVQVKNLLDIQRQQMMSLLRSAETVATDAHSGQIDIGGHSYVEHPKYVANSVDCLEQKIVAWLHDVLEDTELTEKDLRRLGFTESIIHSVRLLTKNKSINYEEYLWILKQDRNAREVKLVDLAHNIDTSRLGRELKERDKKRLEKYKQAVEFLK